MLKDVVMLGGYQEAEDRLCRRQSRADAVPLPPATAHGFRVHDPVRLRVNAEPEELESGDGHLENCRPEKTETFNEEKIPASCSARSGGDAVAVARRRFDEKVPTIKTSWQRDLLAWRAQRATDLQAPEGWLSLIALGWLKEGDNSFGSAEDSRVQIAGKGPAHIAIVRLGERWAALAASGRGFPEGPSGRWSTREGAGSVCRRCRQTLEADDRHAHHHRDSSRRPICPARQGSASSHPRRLPRIALVRAECRLPRARALDPVQPSQSARYPYRPWHHDPSSRAGRRRIHAGWTSSRGWSPCSKIRNPPIFSLFCATPPARLRRTVRDAFCIPNCPTMA